MLITDQTGTLTTDSGYNGAPGAPTGTAFTINSGSVTILQSTLQTALGTGSVVIDATERFRRRRDHRLGTAVGHASHHHRYCR